MPPAKGRLVRGFTMVELMIVVAVITILAAVAIPKFTDMVTRSKEARVRGNLGILRSALSIYYGDNESVHPADWASLTIGQKYLTQLPAVDIPQIPSVGNPGHTNAVSSTGAEITCAAANTPTFNDCALPDGCWNYVKRWDDPSDNCPGLYGTVYIGCTHKDSRGIQWTSF